MPGEAGQEKGMLICVWNLGRSQVTTNQHAWDKMEQERLRELSEDFIEPTEDKAELQVRP